ncbi:sugar phosphate nucleotidyltransferase [Bacteroidota bacterium]|jgi:glucose-1-phosphate thymidylyltransferase|nr:NTP transferase domain-containing protein [Balneolaceae bacterium]MDA0736461.1 sugar phosphate nucleotidyltransferase [Bacteroidota bacterium]MBL6916444.1 NTP transferase domain-containing protein [Balneolaceae bacterium]MCH1552568.1 NTP transferase domain-containing protein [Balneolaceae bacterium]MDA1125825.1 sugar phosphate nucleotidyltransferase [Bacteroidota bacterium]
MLKGVILAGGTGSRLYPLTKVTNKHLLPVGNKPMIFHPIEKLTGLGIQDILIVTGTEHMGDVVNLLGSGAEYNCRFTYKVQDQAGGIAQALGLAENFAGQDPIVVILGDNIFEDDLTTAARTYTGNGAMILLKQVPDPQRYGVALLDGDKVIEIQEKPENPPTSFAVTGVYFYDSRVFSAIRDLKPSRRGELEITDVNNYYIRQNQMSSALLEGWWTDAGTPDSYRLANQLTME